jgi:hypothetical protein
MQGWPTTVATDAAALQAQQQRALAAGASA